MPVDEVAKLTLSPERYAELKRMLVPDNNIKWRWNDAEVESFFGVKNVV